MNSFDFQEYWINGCIFPLLILIIAIAFIVIGLIGAFKIYQKVAQKHMKKFIGLVLMVLCFFLVTGGLIFAATSTDTLQYGVHLLGENEDDAIELVGRVDKIDAVPVIPSFSDNHEQSTSQAAEVTVDGVKYYFMSTHNIHEGDILRIKYLPKSKMVLSYESAPVSEWTASEPEPRKISPLVLIAVVVIGICCFVELEYFAPEAQRKAFLDDESWTKDEIRFHSVYRRQAIFFAVVGWIAGLLIGFLTAEMMSGVVVSLVSICGMVIVIERYNNWRIEYNETELIYYFGYGRKEIIPMERILSVNEAYENMFLSKGQVYRIVTIRYRSNSSSTSMIASLKLDFRYHVGIRRFLQKIGNDF
jgi:membrane protein YdbS with pleckstrin-like domain